MADKPCLAEAAWGDYTVESPFSGNYSGKTGNLKLLVTDFCKILR